MPTINDFRERYPEFKEVDGFRIDLFFYRMHSKKSARHDGGDFSSVECWH